MKTTYIFSIEITAKIPSSNNTHLIKSYLLWTLFQKGDFIGRDALVKQKENGISQKFVQFLLKDFDTDNDVWPWGGEPIYRNGKFAGTVTSSAYGPTLEKMICLGFVRDYDENDNRIIHKNINQFIMDKDANYEVVVGGQRFQAEARLYTTKEAYTSSDPVFIPVPKKESDIKPK